MKKIYIITALILLAMGHLFATETITFWYGASPEEKTAYEKLITDFEKENPDIKVNAVLVPQSYIERKLILSIAGEVPPDVVRFYAHLGGNMMSKKALLPLDDFIKKDTFDKEDFYPAALKQNQYQGKLYGIPWILSPNALYYNKKLLKSVGYTNPPKTHKELLDCAKKLTKKDNKGSVISLGYADFLYNPNNFALYLWQEGGELVNPETKKATFNSKEGLKTLKFMSDFIKEEAGSTENIQNFTSAFKGNVNDPFGKGVIAMRVDSPYRVAIYKKNFPNLDFGVTTIPYSQMPASEIVGNSLIIPATSKHKEAAWKFIKFATEKEQMINVCLAGGRIPARKSAALDDSFYKDPIYKGFIDQLDYGHSIPIVPGWNEANDALARELEKYLKGTQDAQTTLTNGEKIVNSIIEQADEDMSSHTPVNWSVIITIFIIILLIFLIIWTVYTYKHTKPGQERKEARDFYLFLLPWIIGFLILTLGSVLASLVISFTKWDVLTQGHFVGLRNFTELFADSRFIKSIWVTFVYTVFAVPLSVVFGLFVSMLLAKGIKGIAIFRALYYMPSIISGVATSVLWINIFSPKGLLNNFLNLHIVPWIENGHFTWLAMYPNADGWLINPQLVLPAFIIMSVWAVGSSMIVYLAAIQGVPEGIYEAADIDGASPAKQFFSVTLPLISPAIFYQLVTGIIFSLQMFTQAFILNSGTGGPEDSGLFYGLYLYNNAFQYLNLGKASAMAWMLFIVVMIVTYINFKLAGKWVYYDGDKK
ncbi:MAG: extracellular solute-binding protein [Abditibacteriota bacterium]|nr:extracellular solute-binding protein [Abditibacteriota bacterium]